MLAQLVIRDIGLIEHAEMEFGPGLQVITGETGVGKSMLLSTLLLLSGERARADRIRDGVEEARVIGFLVLPDTLRAAAEAASGLELPDGELRIERRLRRTGRSQALINGQEVALAQLQQLGTLLIEIQGQRAQLRLLDGAEQLMTLDRYAGLEAPREAFARELAQARVLAERIDTLARSQRTRADRRRALERELAELDQATLTPGERPELERELELLEDADRIRQLVAEAIAELYEGEPSATDLVGRHRQSLASLAHLHPALAEFGAACDAAHAALDEAVRALRSVEDSIDPDPDRLATLSARLSTLERLEQRYQRADVELIAYRESMREEFASLSTDDAKIPELEAELRAQLATLGEQARTLTQARRRAARELAAAVATELPDLGLAQATFEVRVEAVGASGAAWHGFTPTGADRVGLHFGPNPGEVARALEEIASGGELSRVMLALQRVLAGAHRVPVLVFDEIDAGVGGRLGTELGRKLSQIARDHQVICVTHLAQIASWASRHLHVSKQVVDGRTRTLTEVLEDERRVDEIAAMIRGAARTATSRAEAREMLAEAAAAAGGEGEEPPHPAPLPVGERVKALTPREKP